MIQIVDAAVAEAARKSGPWLVCRPGCAECCLGPFPITRLDAHRLRRGLAELEARDSERASRVRERANRALVRMSRNFPGDPATGILADDDPSEKWFCDFEGEPCPALDPETGTCDLYFARPITCRTFGPPVRFGFESVGVCALCFHGATDAQIAACEVEIDPDGLEWEILKALEETTGTSGGTTVAFALGL